MFRTMMGRPGSTVAKAAGLAFGAAVASMLLLAGVAYGCTNLATLNLSTGSGGIGDSVTVTGSSFAVPKAAGEATFPVTLAWDGAAGTVLGQAVPDAAGNISATFAVPESAVGYHVIIASQSSAEGTAAYGTPARAAFLIVGPNGQPAPVVPATQSPAVTGGSGNGILALTIGLGVAGLALFGAGFVAFARQARRQEVPATAKVRNRND